MPIASAHPMSLPPDFQFGRSRHARHLFPRITPMPTDELASEYPWTLVIVLSPGISREREGEERVISHHVRSSSMSFGGCRGMKGRDWKVPIIFSKPVRCALPRGVIRQAYSSLPYSLRTSSRVCTFRVLHSLIARRYFSFLSSGSDTFFPAKSHVKPMKGTTSLNAMSLDTSHGIPRGFVISSISSKSYG